MEPKLNEKIIYTVCTVLNNNKLLELNRKIKEKYYIPYDKVTYISEEEYETLRDNFLKNIKINYNQLINNRLSKKFLEDQLNILTKNEVNKWCIDTTIIINNCIRPFVDYLPNLNNMPNNWSIVDHLNSIISSILFYGSEFKRNGLIEKVKMFKCPKCNEITKEIFLPEFCHTYRCHYCIDKFDRDMHEDYLKYKDNLY